MAEETIPKSVWLWLSDEETWGRFSEEETAMIWHAQSIGNKGLVLERNYTTYFLDLLRFTQTNACTGRRRTIQEVKAGSRWLVQKKADTWESFSKEETNQLEHAFFEGSTDFVILQRGTKTHCYVDFGKWTMTDLETGEFRYLKVESSEELSNSPSSDETCSCVSNSSSLSQTRSQSDDMDASEGTETTVSEEFEPTNSSLSSPGVTVTSNNKSRRQSTVKNTKKKRASPSWRWHNDSESWSSFEEEIAEAIERSWESGIPELMYERASDTYFIDLKNLTQTNVATGYTRAIQRVVD